jgi:hypothetical protein
LAFRRLCFISAMQVPGTLEQDFWQTIAAVEHHLKEEGQ